MIAHSVAEIVKRHVRLTVEGIDRMYLNVYVPGLQYEHGINRFFRYHRGQPLPCHSSESCGFRLRTPCFGIS